MIFVFVTIFECRICTADCVQAQVEYSRVGARVDYLVGQAPVSLSSMTWPHQLTALPPLLYCAAVTQLCTAYEGFYYRLEKRVSLVLL